MVRPLPSRVPTPPVLAPTVSPPPVKTGAPAALPLARLSPSVTTAPHMPPATSPGPSAAPLPISFTPASAYEKNGHMVIDTERRDSAGHVPTHRLDQASGKLPSETWQQYEDRVLARSSFSPDTAQSSSLSSLQRPVADGARSLMDAAKSAGVSLNVSETKRSQERQEMLFQKGRKGGSGEPVTWTLTSDHTPGRALDFTGNDKALRWLQQNAPKFGFTVMGAMDPGHVSMP